MEDSFSFVSNMRMEPLEFKRATPTLREHLNQALSRAERQEHSGSVAEAPRLTMPK